MGAHGLPRRRRAAAARLTVTVPAAMLAALAALAPASWAQVAPTVWTVVTPPTPIAGTTFRLDIHVSGLAAEAIRVLEPELPAGLTFVSGPELRAATSADSATAGAGTGAGASASGSGSTGAPLVIGYTLRARRSGSYLLEGFLVRVANQPLYTRATPITVAAPPAARSAKPAVSWVLAAPTALVGEAVSVELVLTEPLSLRLPEQVEVRAPPNAWFEQYDGDTAITEQVTGELTTYRLPLAAYLLTPTRAGRVTVPSARVTLQREDGPLTVFSEAVTIDVREAPPEVSAVGELAVRSWLEQQPTERGVEVTVHVMIEGSGNPKFAKLPEPVAAEVTRIDHSVREQLRAGTAGYTGHVLASYRYFAPAPGTYTFEVPDMITMDPVTDTRRVHRGLRHTVVVTGAAEQDSRRVALQPLRLPTVQRAACQAPMRRGRSYLLLVPAPVLIGGWLVGSGTRGRALARGLALALAGGAAVVALLPGPAALPPRAPGYRQQAELLQRTIAVAERAYALGDYQGARDSYQAALGITGCNGALAFNIGISELGRQRLDHGVAWLRAAARVRPGDAGIRRALAAVEAQSDLSTQHRAMPFVAPAVPFFGLLITVNLVAIAFARQLRRAQGGAPVSVALLALLCAAAAVLLVAATFDGEREIAVTRATALKKVPLSQAADWITLAQGTTLEVRDRHRGFALVRTAYGLDAWVDRSALVDRLGAAMVPAPQRWWLTP